MTYEVADQVIVVVGATRGIGAAIATDLANHGAQVILAGRDLDAGRAAAASITAHGGAAHAIGCDVTDPTQVEALFEAVEQRHGRLDTLFANQGVAGPAGLLTNSTPDWVQRTLDVNLVGCLHLAQGAEKLLAADGGGRFIVTGSGSGHTNMPGLGIYGVSKAAVSHLVRQLAVEWRRKSIAVNELIPGPVRTAMTGFEAGAIDDSADSEAAASFERFADKAGEWLKDPADVTPMARFLAELPPHGPTGKVFSLSGRV